MWSVFTAVPQKHKANQVRYNLARFVVSVYYGLQTCLNATIRINHEKSNLDASGRLSGPLGHLNSRRPFLKPADVALDVNDLRTGTYIYIG